MRAPSLWLYLFCSTPIMIYKLDLKTRFSNFSVLFTYSTIRQDEPHSDQPPASSPTELWPRSTSKSGSSRSRTKGGAYSTFIFIGLLPQGRSNRQARTRRQERGGGAGGNLGELMMLHPSSDFWNEPDLFRTSKLESCSSCLMVE